MILAIILVAFLWALATSLAFRKPGPFPQGFYKDLLALGTFAALVAGFFWQVLFLPDAMVPRGGGDLASFLYPLYSFAARNLQQGIIPLWNPYQSGGMPFAADMQTGLFYPPNLLAFLLVRPFNYQAMEALAILHYFLAALFMYIFARGLGLGRAGSLGTGAVFAFGGFAVAHLGHLNMLSSAVWLPLVLYFFHRALARQELLWAVAAGAAYAVSILPGHVQMTLYFAFFLVLYWLWGLLAGSWRRGSGLRWPSSGQVATLPLTLVVAFGLAAVQLLPSFEMTNHSIRAALTYREATQYALSPLVFITLLIPHFLGPDSANYWGVQGNLTEVFGYVGILPLVLAAMAAFLSFRPSPWRWFFVPASAFFLLLSLGQETVLHGWLYRFGPGFDKVRAPGRFILFFDFAIAALAGMGLDALTRPLARRDRPTLRVLLWAVLGLGSLLTLMVALLLHALATSQDKDPIIFQRIREATNSAVLTVFFVALALAVLLLHRYRSRWRAVIPLLAVLVIMVDLFSAGASYNATDQDILEGFRHPQVVAFLKRDPEPFRIDSDTGVWDVWQPSTNLNHEIGDVRGLFNPMTLADFDRYWGSLGSRSVPAYDLLNAKYVVAHKDVVLDWAKFQPVLTDAPKVNVYQNMRASPRALIVPRAEVLPRQEILERLRRPDFDPSQTLYLEEGRPRQAAGADFSRRLLSVSYPTPNEVVVEAESQAAAYLFLADVMYPGWKAVIDGAESPVLRANYLFRAVEFPAGRHIVRFAFSPRTWTLGWGTSLLFLVGVVSTLAVATLRKGLRG